MERCKDRLQPKGRRECEVQGVRRYRGDSELRGGAVEGAGAGGVASAPVRVAALIGAYMTHLGLVEIYLDTVRYTRGHYRGQLQSRLAIHWHTGVMIGKEDLTGWGRHGTGKAATTTGYEHMYFYSPSIETVADGQRRGESTCGQRFYPFGLRFDHSGQRARARDDGRERAGSGEQLELFTRRSSDARSGRVPRSARG